MSICGSGLEAKTNSVLISIQPENDHPLIKLAQALPWEELAEMVREDLRESTITKILTLGRKLKIRIHLGAYLLQQMHDFTDRAMERHLKDNVAYQVFCGHGIVDRWHAPDHTKIEEFRSRIMPETHRKIANLVAQLGVKLGFGDPSQLDHDSTVQEAGITYPSDARLLVKMGGLCGKVFNHLLKLFPEPGFESFDFKKIKAAAREYFFSLKAGADLKKQKFKDLYYTTFLECCRTMELDVTDHLLKTLPWYIRRAWEQIKEHGKKYFSDVEDYIRTGKLTKGKVMSFHLRDIACFNKGKEGKGLQFGRQFQLGRIGGNFMLVSACTSIRMEDKHSVRSMIEEHQQLFGEGELKSYGTDKGYYSQANISYVKSVKKLKDVCVQRPGLDLSTLSEQERVVYTALTNRRSGIEPLIGHIKKGGQLERSRMKTDASTLASGYSAVAAFNLKQLVRHITAN